MDRTHLCREGKRPTVHDLSHQFADGMTTFPGDPEVTVDPATDFDIDGYRVTDLGCGSHAGTHVDAPAHTEADGKTLDEFDLDRFVLETIRVDCRDLGARERISSERVPSGDADCVVFHTGWDEHWDTDRYRDHPFLAPATAERCAERGLAVGTDTLNPDPTPSPNATADEPDGFPAHHAVLGDDCLIVENLTGLAAVPERFELRAYPLPLGTDGAPVRAVGVPLDTGSE